MTENVWELKILKLSLRTFRYFETLFWNLFLIIAALFPSIGTKFQDDHLKLLQNSASFFLLIFLILTPDVRLFITGSYY